MKRGGPPFNGRNTAQAAQRRYLRERVTESKRLDKLREATAQVMVMCILSALNERFGLGEARLQRVVDRASALIDQFDLRKQAAGWKYAKSFLEEKTREYWPGFLLPAVIPPKTERERLDLGEQREVAEAVMMTYAMALHEIMGFGAERVAAFAQTTERVYREFAERAQDGDYYGYELLAQKISRIVRGKVTVDDSDAAAPIFGKTLD